MSHNMFPFNISTAMIMKSGASKKMAVVVYLFFFSFKKGKKRIPASNNISVPIHTYGYSTLSKNIDLCMNA